MKTTSITALLVCTLLLRCYAQVELAVPKTRFKQYESIDTIVVNKSVKPISVCVKMTYLSMRGPNAPEDVETTPTPVIVQVKDRGRWSTLLNDEGFSLPAVLKPGETQHYPIRLNEKGWRMRFLMDFWEGEYENVCKSYPTSGRHRIKSKEFFVE